MQGEKIPIFLIFQSYISFHSYGQKILYPWSYTSAPIDDWKELQEMGEIMAQEMNRSNGLDFTVGQGARSQYQTIGGSDDWARGEMGIKWVFLLELPPGQRKKRKELGFLLPASHIKPAAESIFRGIRALGFEVSHKITP